MYLLTKIPSDLRYTKEHEWVRVENGTVRIGITDFAQEQLHEIVMVELPSVGTKVETDEKFGTVDSVKATSDLFAPVAGEIVAANEALEEAPELVNNDPYGEGWMIVIKPTDPKAVDKLLSPDDYEKLAKE
jgi:glycine cleavage system H protein